MIEMIISVVGFASVLIVIALLRTAKPKTPEEDEHALVSKPTDAQKRKGDGVVTPRGPNAAWNRKRVRK